MVKKQGAFFELEWPHLNPGAIYYFLGNKEAQKEQNKFLIDNRKELASKLMVEVKKEIDFFDSKTSEHYPYLQESEKGIIFHINNGGKYFKLGQDSGMDGQIVSGHNLDYFIENAIAFNSASKLVEIINPKIDAPKILHDENNTLYYPLPNGREILPIKNGSFNLKKEFVQNIYNLVKLGGPTLILENGYQKIENKNGKILIEKGLLKAIPKRGHKEFSWICSKLITFSFTDME